MQHAPLTFANSVWKTVLSLIVGVIVTPQFAVAQAPPEKEGQQLHSKLERLQQQVEELGEQNSPAFLDAAMCATAVERVLRHAEFYKPNHVTDADKVLSLGFERVGAVKNKKVTWGTTAGRHVLAYRSRVDDSLQPYAVTLPEGYNPKAGKRWPLHVVLHGRNGTLSEVSFFASHEGKPAAKEADWIQLDVFGRTNNAYRWAGETDVFEALAAVTSRYKIDERRITLWGFSMGGAGAWHLAVHHPDRWSSAGAGAGFVDFYKYQKKTEQLPSFQHKALHIYDSVDYALNLADIPTVGYGGEVDPQLLAAQTMQARAEELGVPLKVIVGPKMGHKFDPESLKQFMAFHAEHAKKGTPSVRGRAELQFETYTLKYNKCGWLIIHEQEKSGERSVVTSKLDDDGILQVTSENVMALSVDRGVADRVQVNGSEVVDLNSAADANLVEVYFVNDESGWRVLDYDESLEFVKNPELHKRHNLQGPIDDAFMESFLVVTGGSSPWFQEIQAYADWTQGRHQDEFDKWMRGQPRVKIDSNVTAEDIAQHNLILFGDPGGNSQIAAVIEKLPIEWTKTELKVAGKSYDPNTHTVAMIYPNPLNPEKYVVINSGMSMHESDFKASNAWLFPKLGDIAVIKFARAPGGYTEETVWAGFFNSNWELELD
ncbi:MAG: prolyl oligopeptidase family serine peptidase [Planctomycetaceae bacterium]|nr:prolyl oligopeptidase family serine peptidase [Planctomycetaceae bacterium]